MPKISSYFQYKAYFDIFLAGILLIPGFPLIAFLVLLVKLTSKGPGIYSQVRVGRSGKLFTIYKIRSMVIDAEQGTGAVWASQRDPRVTWLGAILRKFHFDELPQLFNVLRGEMALVGPRPERPEFVTVLDREIDGYLYRLNVTPGVTGFAQLNLPPDEVIADVRRKIALDFEYMEKASFFFDIRLILATVGRMFKFAGLTPVKILGVAREIEDSPWAKHVDALSVEHQGETKNLSQLFDLANNTERMEKMTLEKVPSVIS
jgi:lipopolysaccharide/colanic/teichoic acid biosynthesis glycosyltransferase